ncbi:MAG: sugar phosphate isomerase/epimerase [Pirellulaceae bacterium]|nr:sugar phosphate isomerase/epimerase [Pirellulaceae bacterium]
MRISMSLTRRSMIQLSTAAIASTAVAVNLLPSSNFAVAAAKRRRRFSLDLRCSSIGVKADLRQAIHLAHQFGFESVTPDPGYLARLSNTERGELLADMKEKGLVWGSAGLPLDFRKDENTFRAGVENLPKLAQAMKDSGVDRVGTYLMPRHDELTYVENFRQHASRLRVCATILKDHGQRFGLEYVGPKTLWTSARYSFVHSMRETKNLIAEIGVDNVGFVLDSWHWYTAHETVDDLKTLSNADIVACDLNDAPSGREIDEQIDNQRELPMATGVIDLKSFLSTLIQLEYDGPIRAEPFNAALNKLDNEAAVEATAKAMKQAFALV